MFKAFLFGVMYLILLLILINHRKDINVLTGIMSIIVSIFMIISSIFLFGAYRFLYFIFGFKMLVSSINFYKVVNNKNNKWHVIRYKSKGVIKWMKKI